MNKRKDDPFVKLRKQAGGRPGYPWVEPVELGLSCLTHFQTRSPRREDVPDQRARQDGKVGIHGTAGNRGLTRDILGIDDLAVDLSGYSEKTHKGRHISDQAFSLEFLFEIRIDTCGKNIRGGIRLVQDERKHPPIEREVQVKPGPQFHSRKALHGKRPEIASDYLP
jgi:hypothetical protein